MYKNKQFKLKTVAVYYLNTFPVHTVDTVTLLRKFLLAVLGFV